MKLVKSDIRDQKVTYIFVDFCLIAKKFSKELSCIQKWIFNYFKIFQTIGEIGYDGYIGLKGFKGSKGEYYFLFLGI